MSQAVEIGTEFVRLVNEDKEAEILDKYYDENIVSIEGQDSEEMPGRMEGIAAIRGKHAWWFDNHEVHATQATGPFCGHREDQFVVQFDLDVTPKASGERQQMSEVGLYTLKDGKIVQEEYLYRMG